MKDRGHPDYPVEGGRPALTEEELRTDEHAGIATESPGDTAYRVAFLHDAVEVLDPGEVHGYPSAVHAAEALGLRYDYGEMSAETMARCLTTRQARLEERGFAMITADRISDRTGEAISRMDFSDGELLEAYILDGAPPLEDEAVMKSFARTHDLEGAGAYRRRLRRAVRRLATALDR